MNKKLYISYSQIQKEAVLSDFIINIFNWTALRETGPNVMNDNGVRILYEYCLVILHFSCVFNIILLVFGNDINPFMIMCKIILL